MQGAIAVTAVRILVLLIALGFSCISSAQGAGNTFIDLLRVVKDVRGEFFDDNFGDPETDALPFA
ncbi:MAG: hypothetical protein HN853_05565, partial [Halieaceae bacterium]|nr:hypothetical protein [Halieaceae bacterium]